MSFSALRAPEEQQNKTVAKLIGRGLSKKEQLEGFIYITEQSGANFCKVGYAKKDAARRIKAIGKCDIVTSNSYQIGSFVGAYRAEQLIHKLLSHRRRFRYDCPCGCKNREWYEIDFEQVKLQVLIVFSWFRANPYGKFPQPEGDAKAEDDAKPKELEKVWQDALKRWESTQEGPKPLEWDAFFINGPTMLTVMGSSCRTPPRKGAPSGHSSSVKRPRPNHLLGSGRKPVKLKHLLKRGLVRAMTGLSRHDGDTAKGFHFPNVRRGSSGRTTPNLSRQPDAENEAPDVTPSKSPQTRRQHTWDYWFDAEAKPASNITPSSTRTNLQQSATANNLQESPSVSSLDDLAGISKAGSVKCGQENSPQSVSDHAIDKNSTFLETDYASASYCFQGASTSFKRRSPGVRAEAAKDVAPQVGASSRHNDEMIEIAARLANMPGAFPDAKSEESSPKVLTLNEIPRSPTHFGNTSSPADAYVQEPLSGGAGEKVSRASIGHGGLENSCSNVAQNMDESISKTMLFEGEVPTSVASVSTTACEEVQPEKTTKSVLLDSDCEAESASIAALQRTAELPSPFFEKRGDSIIYECKTTNYRPPYCRQSSEESQPVDDGAGFGFERKITLEHVEEETAEEEPAEDASSEVLSKWDTASSLSDDDRPQMRQRALEKELIGLCKEHNYYTSCQIDLDYNMGRLKKLEKELKTMDLGNSEQENSEGNEDDDDGAEEEHEDDDEEEDDEEKDEEDDEDEDEDDEEEEYEPAFQTKNWADEPSDDDPADLDWLSDEDVDSRYETHSGEGEFLFDEDDKNGQATSEIFHYDKNLSADGRLPGTANWLPTPIKREPVGIGLRIADRPHYPASAYTERTTFRMKERVWGDPHNPVKITFSDSRILGAFSFNYQH
jgi:hypothetical protein